jgi:hypothetical protein
MTAPRSVVVVSMAASLRLVVAQSSLKQNFGPLVLALGHDLAVAVRTHVQQTRLGYFPALDYFADQPGFDRKLLATAVDLAGAVRDYAQREVQKDLIPIFSSATVKRASSPAFTLPRISCNQPDVLEALARHYHPGTVRLDMVVSSVERGPDMALMEKITRRKLLWNLRDHFEQVEVTDARLQD